MSATVSKAFNIDLDPLTITVRVTKNFGREAIYPVCKRAVTFAELTGKQTFSREDIARIRSLGFIISVQAQTL